MARRLLIPLERIDPERTIFDLDAICKRNAHRHEMQLLDRIVFAEPEESLMAGMKEVREDEFWVRGHFPGQPLFPGVLMLEAAAQVCSFQYSTALDRDDILGFGAADGVKFRGQVVPPSNLLILTKMIEAKPRTARFETQGVVDGKVVFEASILGIVL